jgi:hypothetical protein
MAEKKPKKVPKMSAYKPSAKMIADATGAKERTVYGWQQGNRVTGPTAKKIAKAHELLADGQSKLVEAVRLAVNF